MRLILINKPFGVLTAFRAQPGRRTLADILSAPRCHPAGRLDHDSEGLLLLTDDGPLQALLSHPRYKVSKTYCAQVEGVPDEEAIECLRIGVELRDGLTQIADARAIPEPQWLWPRDPPIRHRRTIPVSWLEIGLREGRNRQVRRMTAAVGHPTLRLIRWSVGPLTLAGLAPGAWRDASTKEIDMLRRARGRASKVVRRGSTARQ